MTAPENLLLQATPALLDGWCGPVLMDVAGILIHLMWANGIVASTDPDDIKSWAPNEHEASKLYLDLSREECRARVAGVCAVAIGGGTLGHMLWLLACPAPVSMKSRAFSLLTRRFPGLADLDPYDDARLSGGVRLVDTLGLLCVARAVLTASAD